MDNNLNLLAELVNIDSGTGNQDGLNQIAEILRLRLRKLGIDLQTMEANDGSRHYLASRGQGKRILLLAHLDTVFAKGTAAKRSFSMEGEMAHGPGVSDCKSGVVTIIGALEYLHHLEAWPNCEICCLFNTDEEIGSPGSRALIEQLATEAKAVLVVEPAEGENVTVSRKGIGRFVLQVFGRAAHSGSNYLDGTNAILELAHKIIAIQGLTDFDAGITLNVGVISGGVRPNIIPDYAEAEVDLRMVHPQQAEMVIEELNRIVAANKVNGVTAKLNGTITRPPMPLTDINQCLFYEYRDVARKLAVETGPFHSGGGSDANFAAALGVPTIDGLGPCGGGHHSESEFLWIPSLNTRIKVLGEFLKSK